jgi:hypothetical protein
MAPEMLGETHSVNNVLYLFAVFILFCSWFMAPEMLGETFGVVHSVVFSYIIFVFSVLQRKLRFFLRYMEYGSRNL